MAVQAMYKDRWAELFVCALVVSLISLLINTQNPAGIVIVTSFSSTALALMVAPGSNTNSIRAVYFSYTFAMFISVSLGLVFSLYLDALFENQNLLFFIKFYVMLLATLILFGIFSSYHPPAIGAMLTYFIDTSFDDLSLLLYVPISVIFLLASIKSYIYIRHSDEFKWKDIGKEFRSNYKKIDKTVLDTEISKKARQIARALKKEKVDISIISKSTNLSEKEINKL